jgi:hypothetical protein
MFLSRISPFLSRWSGSRIFSAVLFVLAALFALFMLKFSMPEIRLASDRIPDLELQMPHQSPDAQGTHGYVGTVRRGWLPVVYQIIPDDRIVALEVNGQRVSLDTIPPQALSDWGKGFRIDLSPVLHSGTNSVRLELVNQSGPGGIDFTYNLMDPRSAKEWLMLGVLLASMALAVACFLRIFRLPRFAFVILCAAALLLLIYMWKTPYFERTFDVREGGGHLDYIHYVGDHLSLPPPGEGWEYHQPPLYYVSAALVLAVARALDVPWDRVLQLFSLLLFVGFLAFSAKTLLLALGERCKLALLAVALLAFWPSGVIHAPRLGNDVAFYMLAAAAFYFTVSWWLNSARRVSHLYWAVAFSALAFITKSNGVILIGIVGLLYLLRVRFTKVRQGFAILGAWALAFLVNFADNIWLALTSEKSDWLLSNVGSSINQGLLVGNQWVNYWVFDSKTYLLEPFTNTWNDNFGRQYFWNFLLKSSLFSEFSFAGEWQSGLASMAGFLLLGLLVVALHGTWTRSARHGRVLPFVLLAVFSLGTLLAYRTKMPYSCNTDFRYIYPVLISGVFFYALKMRDFRLRGQYVPLVLGGLVGLGMAVTSVLFYLSV